MRNCLYLYNHGQTVFANDGVANLSIQQIRENVPVDWDQPEWHDLRNLPDLSEGMSIASHVIGHFDPDGSEAVTLQKLDTENPTNTQLHQTQYLLVLTTQLGILSELHAHQDKTWIGSGGDRKRRFVLYARDTRAATRKETLRAFFAITPSQAEAIVSGAFELVPEELRILFGLGAGINHLIALSILCQGALILEADAVGENSAASTQDDKPEIVQAAIHHLLPDGRANLEIKLSSEGKKKALQEMRSSAWWQEVFAESTDLDAVFKREWGDKDDDGWKNIHALSGLISPAAEETTHMPIDTVAAAYLSLSARLGKR